METCGFIMSKGSDLENFLMRCSYCTIDVAIEQWHDFVLHFRTTHGDNFEIVTNELKTEETINDEICNEDKLVDVPKSEEEIDNALKELTDTDVPRPSLAFTDRSLSENESVENASNAESEQEEGHEETSYLPTNKFDPLFHRRDARTLAFIESYKGQPCLWDPGNSNYKEPAACKAALSQLRSELETNIGVMFTDHSLKAAIKKLHLQFNAIEKRVSNGRQRSNSVAFSHFTRCAFLKASTDSLRPPSPLTDASLSENESAETDSNVSSEQEDECEEGSSFLPTNKFNPSFFRQDVRTLTFIESYKSQPCLWNPTNSKFKDPAARRAAYNQLISELETSISVIFTELSLKAAIKKLHMQFSSVEKRVLNGSQKSNSIPYSHYTRCSFLKVSQDAKNSFKIGPIHLNFSIKNTLTTDFIHLYGNYPQLYDAKHKDFSKMDARKRAYEEIKAGTIASIGDVSSDDIYFAIQCLRQWYFKSTKNAEKEASESELFYIKECAFMPHKTLKQRLICEICQQKSSSDHILQAHMHKAHNIGELPFKCSSCDRRFISRSETVMHEKRVHIGKTTKCNYCERTFAVSSDLRVHMRTHTGNNILCELCGKAFRLRSQLKSHVTAIHTKIRAFKCTMCPKDFIKKVDLTDHIKSHLNIRDKICSTCGKGFTSCHSLIRHRQIHSEVKKFVCKLCDARFSQFVGLNSHMKRTHNIVRSSAQKSNEITIAEQRFS